MSNTDKVAPAQTTASVKDSGRVRIGAGLMRYTSASSPKPPVATNDAGRVRVGAGLMRFAQSPNAKPVLATKDSGRVRIGAGLMRFASPVSTKTTSEVSRVKGGSVKTRA